MTLWRSLQTALGNLRVNKMRSALTMLGVIIGVSSVIIMVSIVEGTRYQIVKEFEKLGSRLIIIAYQPDAADMKSGPMTAGLTNDDVTALQQRCDLVEMVSPESNRNLTLQHVGHRMDGAKVTGVEPSYESVRDATVQSGRFVSSEDLLAWAPVCVIGSGVAKELFPHENPLGNDLIAGELDLTVVGVLVAKGDNPMGGGADKSILIPISTMQKRITGVTTVDAIYAQSKDPAQLDQAEDQIWACIMRRHDNNVGFRVDSMQNLLQSIGRILTIFGLVLGSIAGLSLLVGGIGIMNIMLVSVTERTKEIGLRKAVGAKRRDILVQFLIESASVSGLGGLIGIGLGAGVAFALSAASKTFMKGGPAGSPGLPAHLPAWAVLGAFAFSCFVGVFFGIYPAVRAARMDPIQALRHE